MFRLTISSGGRRNWDRLFECINSGQSTATVGESHIGKSSVLRHVADPEITAKGITEPSRLFIDKEEKENRTDEDPD